MKLEEPPQVMRLPDWLLSLLVCPIDKSELSQVANELICLVCGRIYHVRDGIPIMIPEITESER
jgi:uncharacterized protein YbaR (Trm112 family)